MSPYFKILNLTASTLLLLLGSSTISRNITLAQESNPEFSEFEEKQSNRQVEISLSDFILSVSLDLSLGNDILEAKQALALIPYVEVLPTAREESDLVLGRMTNTYYQKLKESNMGNLPAVGSPGLFSTPPEPISGSFGVSGENLNNAIKRLRPKLRALQLAYILTSGSNNGRSQLDTQVTLRPENREDGKVATANQIAFNSNEVSDPETAKEETLLLSNIETFSLSDYLVFEFTNNESHEIYFSVFIVDSQEKIDVLIPNTKLEMLKEIRVNAHEMLSVPDSEEPEFVLQFEEEGTFEIPIIASDAPFQGAIIPSQRSNLIRDFLRRPEVSNSNEVEIIGRFVDVSSEGAGASRGLALPSYPISPTGRQNLIEGNATLVPIPNTTQNTRSSVFSITVKVID